MADDLAALRRDLQRLLDDVEPLQHAVGKFGKDTALDVAERDLGGDMAFSGMARKVRLGAGYDLGEPVVLNLRPAGLWILADKGRKGSKRITPKKRRGAKNPPHPKAVRTPQGWRAYSNSTPSRGLGTLETAETSIERGIVAAAEDGLAEVIQKAGFS